MRSEEVIKYPKLGYLRESPYGGRELVGKLIFWEEKRDGCLHSDTKIITNIGELRINEVIKQRDSILVLTYNWRKNMFEYQPILGFIKRRHTHPFVTVHLRRSKKLSWTITVTENHLFATEEGWKEAKKLKAGDRIFMIGREIPYIQRQIILGTLLGDGSIYIAPSGNCGFSILHSEAQWDYLFLIQKLLGDLVKMDNHEHRGGYPGSKLEKRLTSRINPEISSFLREYCLVNEKKQINQKWVNELSPIAIAFWYMDDGSFDSHSSSAYGQATFHTQSYSIHECALLIAALKRKFNINAKRGKDGALHLDTESSKILFNLIAPYIPASMQYKLPQEFQTGHSYWESYKFPTESFQLIPMKVKKVTEPNKWKHIRKNSREYDIETANHNYFANGILVHNSNIRAFIDENDNLQFGSRNKIPASDDLLKSIKNTGYDAILRTALYTEKYQWNHDIIVFFELLQKGKSPSRIEYHEKDDIAVFDIYDINGGWWNYTRIYQFCYQWKLPIVKLWAVSSYSTIDKLEKQIEKMLDRAKKENREGVVFKSYEGGKAYFFKDRLDIPHEKDIEIDMDKDAPKYPELPEAEVMNEMQKVLDEIGYEQFRDKKIAMPLIARYVAAEAKRRMCSVPKGLYSYYLEKLKEIGYV